MGFEPEVWYCILSSLFSLALFGRFVLKPLGHSYLSLGDMMRILIDEPPIATLSSSAHSARLVSSVWLMMGYVLNLAWDGVMLTLIICSSWELKIDSLRDLAERKELTVKVFEGIPIWNYIASQVDEVARKLSKRLVPVQLDENGGWDGVLVETGQVCLHNDNYIPTDRHELLTLGLFPDLILDSCTLRGRLPG